MATRYSFSLHTANVLVSCGMEANSDTIPNSELGNRRRDPCHDKNPEMTAFSDIAKNHYPKPSGKTVFSMVFAEGKGSNKF